MAGGQGSAGGEGAGGALTFFSGQRGGGATECGPNATPRPGNDLDIIRPLIDIFPTSVCDSISLSAAQDFPAGPAIVLAREFGSMTLSPRLSLILQALLLAALIAAAALSVPAQPGGTAQSGNLLAQADGGGNGGGAPARVQATARH
jgi:hypothetical protein